MKLKHSTDPEKMCLILPLIEIVMKARRTVCVHDSVCSCFYGMKMNTHSLGKAFEARNKIF
jgi:hypothetical protein